MRSKLIWNADFMVMVTWWKWRHGAEMAWHGFEFEFELDLGDNSDKYQPLLKMT